MHAATGVVKNFESVVVNPATIVVEGDSAWVGDWALPEIARLPAVGSGRARRVALRTNISGAGVTAVAAGAGSVWATRPGDGAVWRIDPKTRRVTRIPLGHSPWGVAAGDDELWVTVRDKTAA